MAPAQPVNLNVLPVAGTVNPLGLLLADPASGAVAHLGFVPAASATPADFYVFDGRLSGGTGALVDSMSLNFLPRPKVVPADVGRAAAAVTKSAITLATNVTAPGCGSRALNLFTLALDQQPVVVPTVALFYEHADREATPLQ